MTDPKYIRFLHEAITITDEMYNFHLSNVNKPDRRDKYFLALAKQHKRLMRIWAALIRNFKRDMNKADIRGVTRGLTILNNGLTSFGMYGFDKRHVAKINDGLVIISKYLNKINRESR